MKITEVVKKPKDENPVLIASDGILFYRTAEVT